jgi:acetoacetyl-CoA synthetase
MEAVADAIAVGQRKDGDERIVLFVVLAQGNKLDNALQSSIRSAIRTASSPRHVPAVIAEVPEIPRTVSGKAVELAVRAVIHGEDVPNVGSLVNPEALQYFDNRPELV